VRDELVRDQVFVGRLEELALVSAAATAVRQGTARLVWVEGEPGSGKTAFARRSVGDLPQAFSVLRADADEFSCDEPLGVVAQLGVTARRGAFAAGIELLGILNDHQRAGPVAVVVEDLHWADVASRQALLTAARRVRQDRVLLVVTSRPETAAADGWERYVSDGDRCQRVMLGGLTSADAAELARQTGMPLAASVTERLQQHTNGHPLHMRTLLRELTPDQLAAADLGLPAPRSLASATIARLSQLPAEVRALAAALAVLNGRVPLATAGRVAGVDDPARALEHLLTTEFVTWRSEEAETPVEFSHPLYRAAVYDHLSPTHRRLLHRKAADILNDTPAFEHRVAAAGGADDGLASELALAAGRERDQGNPVLAAKHLLWASALSSERPQQEEHLLTAARLLLTEGQTTRVGALRARLEACTDGPLRSLVLGVLAWNQGDLLTAEEWLLPVPAQAGDDGADAELCAAALARLSALYATQSRGREAMSCATRALSVQTADRYSRRVASIGLAFGQSMVRGIPAGLAQLRERLPEAPGEVAPTDVDLLVTRGSLLYFAGRTRAAIADLRVAARRASEGSRVVLLARARLHLADLLFDYGEWEEALVHARLSLSLVCDEGLAPLEAQAHAVLGAQLAARGDWNGAERHVSAARTAVVSCPLPEGVNMTQLALAALARARQDPEHVIEALRSPLGDDRPGQGPGLLQLRWQPLLIEALVESGDLGAAQPLLAEFAAGPGLDARARVAGLRARIALATGDPATALSHFEQAVSLLGPDDPLLDRVLLHRDFGRLLRARGSRRVAVGQLRAAHELVARVGAEPYRGPIEADLRTCGIRAEVRMNRSPLSLTDRERDVAALVCRGLTNREVAAQLYVSGKAVEYHLGNIYGKLGVRSRRELRAHLAT
jgi:DNA-binding CsgD family transcriptional regulator